MGRGRKTVTHIRLPSRRNAPSMISVPSTTVGPVLIGAHVTTVSVGPTFVCAYVTASNKISHAAILTENAPLVPIRPDLSVINPRDMRTIINASFAQVDYSHHDIVCLGRRISSMY